MLAISCIERGATVCIVELGEIARKLEHTLMCVREINLILCTLLLVAGLLLISAAASRCSSTMFFSAMGRFVNMMNQLHAYFSRCS